MKPILLRVVNIFCDNVVDKESLKKLESSNIDYVIGNSVFLDSMQISQVNQSSLQTLFGSIKPWNVKYSIEMEIDIDEN